MLGLIAMALGAPGAALLATMLCFSEQPLSDKVRAPTPSELLLSSVRAPHFVFFWSRCVQHGRTLLTQ